MANPLFEVFSIGGYPKSNRFFRFFGEFSRNLRFLQKFLGDLSYKALLPQIRDFSILKPTSCKNGPRFWKQMVKKPLPMVNPALEVFSFGGYPKSNRFFRFFGEFSKNVRFLQKFRGDLSYRALLPQNQDFFPTRGRFWVQSLPGPYLLNCLGV